MEEEDEGLSFSQWRFFESAHERDARYFASPGARTPSDAPSDETITPGIMHGISRNDNNQQLEVEVRDALEDQDGADEMADTWSLPSYCSELRPDEEIVSSTPLYYEFMSEYGSYAEEAEPRSGGGRILPFQEGLLARLAAYLDHVRQRNGDDLEESEAFNNNANLDGSPSGPPPVYTHIPPNYRAVSNDPAERRMMGLVAQRVAALERMAARE